MNQNYYLNKTSSEEHIRRLEFTLSQTNSLLKSSADDNKLKI